MGEKHRSALEDFAPLILAELRTRVHGIENLPALPEAGREGRVVFVTSGDSADAGNYYGDKGTEWHILG